MFWMNFLLMFQILKVSVAITRYCIAIYLTASLVTYTVVYFIVFSFKIQPKNNNQTGIINYGSEIKVHL